MPSIVRAQGRFESRVVRRLGILVDLPLFCDEGQRDYRMRAILIACL